MHFGITEKPTMDCISVFNNIGLTSKVSEKIAIENAKKLPVWTIPPPIFAQILYRQKLESLAGVHFCR